VKIGTGAIVDATLIEAPSWTKNKRGARDPEMQQTRKGQRWHFGMKAHLGVDAETKLVHSVNTATSCFKRNRISASWSKARSRATSISVVLSEMVL